MIRRLVRAIAAAGATWSSAMFGSANQSAYWATDPGRDILNHLARIAGAESANELLNAHGSRLRSLSRQLVRNHPTAAALVEGSTAVNVGTGIDLVLDTGDASVDERLQPWWEIARDNAGVHGESLFELQIQAWREKVVVGGCPWRLVTLSDRLHDGLLPSAILPLDEDWFDDRTGEASTDGVTICAGVKLDRWGRMLGAWLRNPERFGVGEAEYIEADRLIYIFERRRPLQSRGEPEMATILETLYQEGQLIAAELASAKNTASYSVFLTSPHGSAGLGGTKLDGSGKPKTDIPLGAVIRGMPGEQAQMLSHTRPSQQIAPFSKFLKGRMAASNGLGQRWLDRDISDANYSSIRADGQDQERISAPKREWFGHRTAGAFLRHSLPWMAMKAGLSKVPPARYRLLPDEPAYVDPLKDEQASMLRITNGKSTFEAEISRTGKDPRYVLRKLAEELKDPLLARIFNANLNADASAPPVDPATDPATATPQKKTA